MNSRIIIGVVIGLLLLGGIAFVLSQNRAAPTDTTETQITEVPTQAVEPTGSETSPTGIVEGDTADEDSVKEFTVTGSNFRFSPATLTVNRGDTVRITFRSTGMNHDFVIDELGVKSSVLPSGEEEVIEFTADQAGTFEYYCSVGNHRQMGMVGTLTVK